MAAALQQAPEMPPLPFRLSLPPPEGRPSGPRLIRVPSPAMVEKFPELAASETGSLRMTRSGLAKLGAVAGLLLCVAVVYAASGGAAAPAQSAPVVATGTAATTIQVPAEAALDRVVDVDDSALELVTVRVSTRPAGASVRLTGGGEVCSATPCAFEVVRGKPISLLARLGARNAVATLSPSGMTDLHLVLAGGAKARPTERAADELKVPEIFR